MEWVAAWHSDLLTPIFLSFTQLVEPWFLFSALPLIYWLWRKDSGTRLVIAVMAAAMLNAHLKALFDIPRPEFSSRLIESGGYSFPSGHAQVGSVLCAWLALEIGKTWAWVVAIVAMVGIALSRVYLGVHTPLDVSVGLAAGLSMVALFYYLGRLPTGWWHKRHPWFQTAALIVIQLIWFSFYPEPHINTFAVLAAAITTGFWLGVRYEKSILDYSRHTRWPYAFVAAGIGLLGVILIGKVLPKWLHAREVIPLFYAIFFIEGFFVSFGAPKLFQSLGLARASEPRGVQTS